MRTSKSVQPVQVDYECETGDGGLMRPTGMSKMSSPPWHIHACTVCGVERDFREFYPHIEYREQE